VIATTEHNERVLEVAEIPRSDPVTIRRELYASDPEAIARMHGRIYAAEYDLAGSFEPDVARELARAMERGWPRRGGVWIAELGGEVAGTLALIHEDERTARIRWFLLDRALRGRGLGRQLLEELIAEADATGYELIRLETFSELTAAARLYRSFGFDVVRSHHDDRWGRRLLHQEYERRAAFAAQ
jgi:ribosomal protein S18 acetylase RimI-like enzyme